MDCDPLKSVEHAPGYRGWSCLTAHEVPRNLCILLLPWKVLGYFIVCLREDPIQGFDKGGLQKSSGALRTPRN